MNIKQKFVASAAAASMAISLFAPFAVAHANLGNPFTYGQGIMKTVGTEATGSAAEPVSLPVIIGRIINIALSLLGLVFLGLALYAGFKWMTAQGDSKGVDEAKDTLKNAVIGIIITVAAYSLSSFIMSQLITVVT